MREQLEAFLLHPSNAAVRAALAAATEGTACLVLDEDGKISLQKSLDCKEFLEDLGQPRAVSGRYKDALTLAEFLDRGKRRLLCDPSTPADVALDRDGVSQDEAAINWGGISEDRLVLVLLGRQLGMLSHSPDPDRRRDWAKALGAKTLGEPWVTLAQEWTKRTPAERDALKDSLIYRARNVRDHKTKFVHVPSEQMGDDFLSPPIVTSTSLVKVVLLHAPDDYAHVKEFLQHAKMLGSLADFWAVQDVRVGTPIQSFVTEKFKAAQVFLHFLSAPYLCTDYPANVEMLSTAVHIPILLRPCLLPNGYLAQKRGLPRDWIVSYRDRDAAWSEVVTGLRPVLVRLRQQP